MGIYAGVNGVVRELSNLDVGIYGAVYHTAIYKAGVNGIIRNLTNVASQIDYVAVVARFIEAYEMDSDGTTGDLYGDTKSEIKNYGGVTINTNSIEVYCNTRYSEIDVYGDTYIVFKDGHRAMLRDVIEDSGNINVSISVTGYVSFTNNGYYINMYAGQEIVTDHVSGSRTSTKTITSFPHTDFTLSAGMASSGTARSRLTFNSAIIDGKSFSMRVLDEID